MGILPPFLARAKEINEEIAKVLDVPADDENDEDSDTESTEAEDAPKQPPVDPAAYTMLRTSLRRKEAAITKGYNWAASAELFFDIARDSADLEQELVQLTVGTLYHGEISAVQVWQILQYVLPELPKPEIAPETCASPWAGFCPPQTVSRKNVGNYPPSFIIQAAQSFCTKQVEIISHTCTVEEGTIPLTIPNGYYGYYSAIPRGENDPLNILFVSINNLVANQERLESLEKDLKQSEKEKKEMETTISNTWKDIGGADGDELGPNGELHSMADKCFDVKAGKYTYEVCIFGQAKQKENSSGGTGLGKWTKMEVNEETGERIMYWENGQKCWNGPKRSATVHVTCGAETKLLTADEPDTCRYVFTMESHIACDEAYKQTHGLFL